MKSRSASEWVKAYDHIDQELTAKGFKPKLQTLDSEASVAFKNFFTSNDVVYQLAPPHTVIAATPLKELFELLKNTLWQGSPLWIQPFHYICGTDFRPKRKSL
jgi:cobalamin biosynthesis Co2+ chelatase CbiK